MTVRLDGKAVVITGSGRGIGAACAMAATSLGARVVVNDIDAEAVDQTVAEIRRAGGQAVGHVADITNWNEADGLIQRCLGEWRRIDGLVNNAGLFRLARLEEQSEAEARAMVEVNIMGTLACSAHAIGHMQKQGSGAIVNVTSGAHLGMAAMGVYGATKGAVASFTYGWAAENMGTGIRVNALSPLGASRMMEERTRYFGRGFEAEEPAAEVNAPVVCFLLSDSARDVTGQIVRIEGRQLSLMAHPGVALPVLEGDWTVDRIAAAFEDDLARRQFPPGLNGMKVELVGAGSAIWESETQRDESG